MSHELAPNLSYKRAYPFGMVMPGREYTVSASRFGFNSKEYDSEIFLFDFSARLFSARICKWLSPDPYLFINSDYSPYVFGNNDPIVVIDPTGCENVVVVGNQGSGQKDNGKSTYDAPNSDKKDGEYTYGENRRHFLERGLQEAIDQKKNHTETLPDGTPEGTTLLVYKGEYTDEELEYYKGKCEENGIDLLIACDQSEIVWYINSQTLNSREDRRTNDVITDFAYIGHGSPWHGMWVGYNLDESEYIQSSRLKTTAFSPSAKVNLFGCGMAASADDITPCPGATDERTKLKFFDDFQNRILNKEGQITGYTVTIIWGSNEIKGLLGEFYTYDQGYTSPRCRDIQRPTIPKENRVRKENGKANR